MRFNVISMHFTNECDLKCPFCYVKKKEERPREFWYSLIPYMKKLAPQVACLHPEEMVFQYNPDNQSVVAKPLNRSRRIDLAYIVGNGEICKVKKYVYKKTKEKMYKIKATGGREIRITENHLIPTKRGLLYAKDLVIGDELNINNKIKTDIIREIDISKILDKKGIKYRLDNDDKIVIERHGYKIKKIFEITPAFARLCGYYTSEGDSKGFTLNKKEILKHEEIIKDFKDTFKIELVKRKSGNSAVKLETGHRYVMKLVFQEGIGLGSGAKNKGIGNVWKWDERMILEYLRGCFNGDGCLRARENKRGGRIDKTANLSYKTASRKLMEEMRFLLEGRLGIYCSTTIGVNKKRKIEGRELPETRYYMLEIYGKNNMGKIVPYLSLMNRYEKFIKIYNEIGTKKTSNSKFISNKIVVKSIENIEKERYVFDLVVDKDRLFTINGNIIVHNCGGGEPFTDIPFIKEFSKRCKENDLICNVTTNGHILSKLSNEELSDILKNITMVSVSWDSHKVNCLNDKVRYINLVKRIKNLTNCQVGANFMFSRQDNLAEVEYLFNSVKVNRVFLLYPKNMIGPDILKMKPQLYYLTARYKNFYIDDTIKMIITEGSYNNWKHPCHFLKDMCSINQSGEVMGCSFDSEPFLKIEEPKDLLKIKEVKNYERYKCPYIKPQLF